MLEVPSSVFELTELTTLLSGSFSTNISLSRHTVPHLHWNICHLSKRRPVLLINNTKYSLVKMVHDREQHLYVKDKQVMLKKNQQILAYIS